MLKRLGPNAFPFTMELTPLAPPSVQLVPAKEYNGAAIGTSYDIRAFAGKIKEKVFKTEYNNLLIAKSYNTQIMLLTKKYIMKNLVKCNFISSSMYYIIS